MTILKRTPAPRLSPSFFLSPVAMRCLLAALLCVASSQLASADRAAVAEAEAQRLVTRAERSVTPERREKLIAHAVRIAPNFAPAQWAAGRIESDGEWLPVRDAQAQNATSEAVAEYEALRQAATETPADHKRLARWCERNGLTHEARHHWTLVLEAAPSDADALRALELVWRDGEHFSRDEARELQNRERRLRREAKDWRRRVARWLKGRVVGDGQPDPVAEELRERFSEAAIPAFEAMIAQLSEAELPRTSRRAQLADLYAEALDDTPTFEATRALVRLAVLAPSDSLRSRAGEGLASRPRNETVPLLLDGLKSPVRTDTRVAVASDGQIQHTHTLVREGRDADEGLQRISRGRTQLVGAWRNLTFSEATDLLLQARLRALEFQARYQGEAEDINAQVARQNAATRALNERITSVLTTVTGEQLGEEPRAWWDYWSDYEGYEIADDRPINWGYEYQEDVSTISMTPPPPPPPPPPRRSCECFAAGTPVWTNKGLAAIETIRPGDFVLAKDVVTGELSFRGVLETTTRDPSPMVEVDTGGEAIRATVGHAFWVVGHGWRKASELSPTDVIAGPQGPIEVGGVTTIDDARAYNLVVEGVATYFVGEAGVLVHDNTRRRPERERLASR